ncbi:MAG: ethanolamine ammonia-lyase subunit EutC [Spirochaetes bacterium]|jgi:ethanolamine ammonia-lyase small subunit|nr:ethanolamine ammonia-lyase subunit EutC [Spirochaetota bacterium]
MDQKNNKTQTIIPNPWDSLKRFTGARIALGRCGASLPTDKLLEFRLAHARAKDAVYAAPDCERLKADIERISGNSAFLLESRAQDRAEYLKRPDLGRRLSEESAALLASRAPGQVYDIAPVISEGLSAIAIERNLRPFLELLYPELRRAGLSAAPACLVRQGRVAVADEVGSLLGARIAVILIGERPGLSSPDSMGIYLTFNPHPGITDERRNCISNVRPEGMPCGAAVSKLMYLIRGSLRLGLSGVALKDEQEPDDALLEEGRGGMELPS